MTNMTTLLVTRDPLVVKNVQQLHDERESARLEVCGRLDKVASQLGWDHRLLLVHDAAGIEAEQVRTILTAADRSHVKAAVLRYADGPGQERQPEFAPYPVYNLPADLPALREVLTSIHREAVRSRPGHTASDAVLDRITATLFGESNDQITQIRRVAAQETTILLTGETGCGKSMLAKFIHASSPRRKDPYLVVDCGALSGNLIESEMFGHARGAFTGAERERQGKFAAAGMGTLVLDEINSLPLPLQTKLLRAVEERVFEPLGTNRQESLRARLVAISNVPLEDEVRSARFRADLYYRLNVVEFRLPSLRERPTAVVPLAHQLLRTSATAACQGVTAISPAALEMMMKYQWPGNIRELRNVIERSAALASGPVIQSADLPESIRGPLLAAKSSLCSFAETASPPRPEWTTSTVAEDNAAEASRILALLRKHNDNRRRAATEFGISRVAFYKKLHRYGLFVTKSKRTVQPLAAG